MKKLPILLTLTASMLLTGCVFKLDFNKNGNNSSKSNDSSTHIVGDSSFTLLVYVCGADLESQTNGQTGKPLGLASMDIEEMMSVPKQPENVNIVLETGGARAWRRSDISANVLGRYHIKDKSLIKDTTVKRANMGAASTLQSFVEWGVENYPADRYGLILWNHGGAMEGCCFDEFTGDALTNAEVYSAMTAARESKGIKNKFEFIAYDACLMAVQDIAEMNSYNFKYMISSQESEDGFGYVYDKWLPELYANPSIDGGELLTVVGSTFMAYEYELFDYYGEACDQTQSVYDLSKMGAYKDAFESLATTLNINSKTKWNKLKSAVNKAKKYGRFTDQDAQAYNSGYLFDIFDVNDVLNEIIEDQTNFPSTKELAQACQEALSDVVIYEEHGDGTTGCGMNLFCPISGYGSTSSYSTKNTNFSTWRQICHNYGSWY